MLRNFAEVYSEMTDPQLIHLSKNDYHLLEKEAQEALDQELKKRGFYENIKEYVDTKSEIINKEELKKMEEEYRNFGCPVCGKKNNEINVYQMLFLGLVFIVFFYKIKIFHGCKNCLLEMTDKFKKRILLSLIIPTQTFFSILSLISLNSIIKKIKNGNLPTPEYIQFVKDNSNEIKYKLKKEI